VAVTGRPQEELTMKMNFDHVIRDINNKLAKKNPDSFNSSWIHKHSPSCYRYILKNIRTELGYIDWDRVTFALDRKFQRRWTPCRKTKSSHRYDDYSEVKTILNKYQDKLYVFLSPSDQNDKRIRDIISITLVRLAQRGNLSAKQEVMKLVHYTIDDWIERHNALVRWQGYREKIQQQLEGCVRRYRYTGSFLNYVFRTLLCAGRGLRPLYAYSLDEPVVFGSKRLKVENVVQDEETNEIYIYRK
jgi:hypothetical protein